MTWTRLDENHNDLPELLTVSRSARLLHVEALTFCNRLGNDGSFRRQLVGRMTDAEDWPALVDELLEAGVWETGDEGFLWIDWDRWKQEPHETVRERLDAAAERNRAYRERGKKHRAGDHSLCTNACPDKRRDASRNASRDASRDALPIPSDPYRPQGREGEEGNRGSAASARSAGAPRAPRSAADNECPHGRRAGLRVSKTGALNCEQCQARVCGDLDTIGDRLDLINAGRHDTPDLDLALVDQDLMVEAVVVVEALDAHDRKHGDPDTYDPSLYAALRNDMYYRSLTAHEWEGTETACTACGISDVDHLLHTHDYVDDNEPDGEENGYSASSRCTRCGQPEGSPRHLCHAFKENPDEPGHCVDCLERDSHGAHRWQPQITPTLRAVG